MKTAAGTGRCSLHVAAVLGASPGHLDLLRTVALAGPAHAWIGAGFVRNAVWDAFAGRVPSVEALADIDVVHHTPDTATSAADHLFEGALTAARPGLRWSVTNQARMAARNHHAPYADLHTAMACWPETATAVAARLRAGKLEILAPHGVDDLLDGILRPTPCHVTDPTALRRRLAGKGWLDRWPALRVIGFKAG